MCNTILFVDDSKLVLEKAKDLFLAHGIEILTADNAMEALKIFQCQDIAVVVSDNCMPGMTGLEFLAKLKEIAPETVKIIMTAHADLTSALEAINKSGVYRFMVKPWQDHELITAVHEGIAHHQLLTSLRKEHEDVLCSLAQAIELKDPSTRGHCDRVAIFALLIADVLQLSRTMKREIKYGSWLHDCGKIGISDTILNGGTELNEEEFAIMKLHSAWGADVAAKANLSQTVRNIIYYHHEKYDGTGYPTGLSGKEIPLEARIVAVADVYDALMTDRSYRKKYSHEETVAILRTMQGNDLDPEFVELFLSLVSVAKHPAQLLTANARINDLMLYAE